MWGIKLFENGCACQKFESPVHDMDAVFQIIRNPRPLFCNRGAVLRHDMYSSFDSGSDFSNERLRFCTWAKIANFKCKQDRFWETRENIERSSDLRFTCALKPKEKNMHSHHKAFFKAQLPYSIHWILIPFLTEAKSASHCPWSTSPPRSDLGWRLIPHI